MQEDGWVVVSSLSGGDVFRRVVNKSTKFLKLYHTYIPLKMHSTTLYLEPKKEEYEDNCAYSLREQAKCMLGHKCF